MANHRKAFHFDLDEDRLKSLYPSESKTGYKSAWGKIQAFMEANGFEHTQYSGYESIHGMSYLQAYKVLEGLQKTYPWFKDCAQVATLTEIGKRHDVLEHLGNGKDIEEPDVSHSEPLRLKDEAHAMRESSRALEASREDQAYHQENER